MEKRLWKIRDSIEDLEEIKDQVLEFLNNELISDENTKNIWSDDAKAFYYNIIAAWEMLRAAEKGEEKYIESSRSSLLDAKSRKTQCISELKTFKKDYIMKFIPKIERIFEKCFQLIISELDILSPDIIIDREIMIVKKNSDVEYELPCSVCGEIAVSFKIGKGLFDKEEAFIFSGITHSTSLKKEMSTTLFPILDKKDLRGVHEFMKKYHGYEGLDAYCPECDKVYCWVHYNAFEEFDEGFYDCTYATCPQGHRRMIDD